MKCGSLEKTVIRFGVSRQMQEKTEGSVCACALSGINGLKAGDLNWRESEAWKAGDGPRRPKGRERRRNARCASCRCMLHIQHPPPSLLLLRLLTPHCYFYPLHSFDMEVCSDRSAVTNATLNLASSSYSASRHH